jgi:hypothetical protein
MKGTQMPKRLPQKMAALLNNMPTQQKPETPKQKKKKKKKKSVPKGFDKFNDEGLYYNKTNLWYYNSVSKLYFQKNSGPFFVFDPAQKKLVPTRKL